MRAKSNWKLTEGIIDQILLLNAFGQKNCEIAEKLEIAECTVSRILSMNAALKGKDDSEIIQKTPTNVPSRETILYLAKRQGKTLSKPVMQYIDERIEYKNQQVKKAKEAAKKRAETEPEPTNQEMTVQETKAEDCTKVLEALNTLADFVLHCCKR